MSPEIDFRADKRVGPRFELSEHYNHVRKKW